MPHASAFCVHVVLMTPNHANIRFDVVTAPNATVARFREQAQNALPAEVRGVSLTGAKMYFNGFRINDCPSNSLSSWDVKNAATLTIFADADSQPLDIVNCNDDMDDTIDLSQDEEDVVVATDLQIQNERFPIPNSANPLLILQHHPVFQHINAAVHSLKMDEIPPLLNVANVDTASEDDCDDIRYSVVQQPANFCDAVEQTPPDTTSADQLFNENSSQEDSSSAVDSTFDITPDSVQQLCALGFSAEVALDALRRAAGNVAAAANMLFDCVG